MMSVPVFFVFFFASKWISCNSLFNNLALTPPMGWTTWGRFRCNVDCEKYPKECISERLIRNTVDKMVEDGYLSAGYEYVVIDDCWLANTRDSLGHLQPDHKRFPSGIKNLSDYVHSRGLKFGMYEDYGTKTCEGYPGIFPSTMEMDARTFANWGVDYIKIDGCYTDPLDLMEGFEKLGNWLLRSGRPMVYACSWPTYLLSSGISVNYTKAAIMCNSWRNYKDIQDSWFSVRNILNYIAEHQEEFAPFAGPGHWNDPDMLVIGNFGLSLEQAKMQMALWAILAAPLIMSNDLGAVRPEFRKILQNSLLIDINQDLLGIQGRRIHINDIHKFEVWVRPVLPISVTRVSWAIAIVSLDDYGLPKPIAFSMKYTKLWGELHYYTFSDLFDVNSNVEFSHHGELLTRIPPLDNCPTLKRKTHSSKASEIIVKDGKNHIISKREKLQRCQKKFCKSKPRTFCKKCDATHCVSCFEPFQCG